jgi:hypothetical protein
MIVAAHPPSSSERRKMYALIYSKYASEERQCFEDEHRKRTSPMRRKQWSGTP